jgi:pimeloyl-ACP methyl ester carboxylesterase
MAERGFCGTVMELDASSGSLRQAVRSIEAVVKSCGYWPPVVVCHSLSTFAAQKYLESFSLSGLVLVNPFPPHPEATFLSRYMSVVGDDDTNSDDGAAAVARAQRVFQLPAGLSLSGRTSKNAFPLQLLREMQADPTSRVRLESGELVS